MLKISYIISLLASLFLSSFTHAAEVNWISKNPRNLVANAHNYERIKANMDCWEGFISNPADPTIELSPVWINTKTVKFLYVKLAAESGSSMQIFFSDGKPVSERLSFRRSGLTTGESPVIYRFDLSRSKLWNGVVR